MKEFITQCTLVFKSFEHDVTVIQSKSSLWQFTTYSRRNKKKYAVMVSPNFSKVKSLIKIAKKKLPPETRLIVIANSFSDADNDLSAKEDFSLLTLETLNRYGQEMLELKNRLSDKIEIIESDSVIDNAINKEKDF